MPDYQQLPLFPLQTVLYPGLTLPLQIFEPRYRLMLQRCLERKEPFGIVLLVEGSESEETASQTQICTKGTTARVTRCEVMDDERYFIEVEGETRFTIDETFDVEPYLTGKVTPFWEVSGEPLEIQPLYDQAVRLFRQYIVSLLAEANRHLASLQLPQDPTLFSFAVAAHLQISLPEKQLLLETSSTSERLQLEIDLLIRDKQERQTDEVAKPAAAPRSTVTPVDTGSIGQFISRN